HQKNDNAGEDSGDKMKPENDLAKFHDWRLLHGSALRRTLKHCHDAQWLSQDEYENRSHLCFLLRRPPPSKSRANCLLVDGRTGATADAFASCGPPCCRPDVNVERRWW